MAARGESRLGLFVIARLAARNGIDVEFRTSPYGGTRAIVLVHSKVLADAEDDPARSAPHRGRSDLVAVEAGPRNGVGLSRHAGAFVPDQPMEPRHSREIAAMAFAPDIEEPIVNADINADVEVLWPAEDDEIMTEQPVERQPVGPPAASNQRHARLPQRTPQDHLVPQLRHDMAEDAPESEVSGPEGGNELGSAEDVRSRISAFQRGSMEGRKAGTDVDQ
jgi:hypothetical protein